MDEFNADTANELVKRALSKNNPYQDNVTVALLKCVSEPETVLIKRTKDSNAGCAKKNGGLFAKFFKKQ